MRGVFVIVWVVAAAFAWVGFGVLIVGACVLGLLAAMILALSFGGVVLAKAWTGLTGAVTRTAARGWEVLCRGL